ncbi:hypothetical protein [Ruegeria sp. PrR005]|uniref:Uncharacterized protein n=1 Tax=Ruegeria sp. PrR005 TaxID=2706882 RepID=A0A6B2NMC1_9RHOB|nr:hypothetical protein [Ruegeria sp. PrR005]NDW43667.1 hypothetical protein [Ruegeria sp. PrR005]
MSVFSEFVTDVMTLTGLGLFFDQVLIGKEEREKISNYLEANADPSSLTEKFLRFLTLSHTVVFGRFFSAKLLSGSFFLSALVISLVSFSLVTAVQVYMNPAAISGVRFDATQYLVIAAFVTFNVFFDYFTIVQTKIFIEASLSAKSIFRSVLFIASDLIVTMNTFILFYAAFVLAVVQFFLAPEVDLIFAREKETTGELFEIEEPPEFLLKAGADELANRITYWGNFSAIVATDMDAKDHEEVTIYYYSTFKPNAADIQPLLLTTLPRLNVEFSSGFSELNKENGGTLVELASTQLRDELGYRDTVEPPEDGGEQQEGDARAFEAADFVVDGSVVKASSLSAAYTATFSRTDFLEDAFPVSLSNLEIVPLTRFVSETASAELGNNPVALCLLENGGAIRILLSSEVIHDFSVCEEVIAVEFIWHWALSRDLSTIGRDLNDRIAPYNTLLITSLLPTFLFYAAIILMAVTTLIYSRAVSQTNRFKRIVLRAPMATAGFILAIPMALLGWL